MTVSTRTRFEVFKRDRFTCAYCGRSTPDVLLHVDHILPIAAGGTDDVENLTTACRDCNLGKADKLLDEGTAPLLRQEAIDEMAERLEQMREYVALVDADTKLRSDLYSRTVEHWARLWGASLEERDDGSYFVLSYGRFPEERSARAILRRLPLASVLDAMDITAGRFNSPSASACRYFYGICWRRIKGES